jgi:hypothetical protein
MRSHETESLQKTYAQEEKTYDETSPGQHEHG